MNFFKRCVPQIVCFILGFFLIDQGVRAILEPYSYFGHYVATDLEKEQGTIDTVFLGSSWTYAGYNVDYYDDLMETTVSFNAGTSGQMIIDSYYYLKELLKSNHITTVYYNIGPNKLQYPKNRYSSPVVNDRLSGINKSEHLIASSDFELCQYYLASVRYRENVNIDYILTNIYKKIFESYSSSNNSPNVDGTIYEHNGYVGSNEFVPLGNNCNWDVIDVSWKEEQIKDYNLFYLEKLYGLCLENNITLILITPPFTVGFLQSCNNYDEYSKYMNNWATQKEVQYIDFNYLINSPFNNDELFKDYSHLNSQGAKVLVQLLCKFLYDKGEGSRPEFCNKLEERQEMYMRCGGTRLTAQKDRDYYFLEVEFSGPKDQVTEHKYSVWNGERGQWTIISDYIPRPYFVYKTSNPINSEIFKVESKVKGYDNTVVAYHQTSAQTLNGSQVKLLGNYDYNTMQLTLYVNNQADKLYRFSKWINNDSFEIIQDASMTTQCKINLPAQGMYRFKVEVIDNKTLEICGEEQLFIDMSSENP